MRIDINKKYFLESDQYEYAIYEKSTVKTGTKAGEDIDKAIGHFTKLDHAINFLVERTVKTSDAINNLKQVQKEVEQIKKDINKILEVLR